MPKHNKPKFKVDQEVVYHAGNWKYRVIDVLWDKDGKVVYALTCNEDDSECQCSPDEYEHKEIMPEEELISYDEWCDHDETCKICHN